MRYAITLLLLVSVPALTAAQSSSPAAPTLPPIGLPLPPIGGPLPPIGLPLTPTGVAPAFETRKPTPPRERDHQGGRGNRQRGPAVFYVGVPYMWDYPATPAAAPAPATAPAIVAAPAPARGWLRLEIQPAAAMQIFVDGDYVGTTDELGTELELEPGSRRIELRAKGYEPLTFNARVPAGQVLAYHDELQPAPAASRPEPAAEQARTPARRQTFYFIPGCYLGNVPPQEVALPAGCDPRRAITRTP
jgi:hypothetical protein